MHQMRNAHGYRRVAGGLAAGFAFADLAFCFAFARLRGVGLAAEVAGLGEEALVNDRRCGALADHPAVHVEAEQARLEVVVGAAVVGEADDIVGVVDERRAAAFDNRVMAYMSVVSARVLDRDHARAHRDVEPNVDEYVGELAVANAQRRDRRRRSRTCRPVRAATTRSSISGEIAVGDVFGRRD